MLRIEKVRVATALLLGLAGCGNPPAGPVDSHPAKLAKHWVSILDPESYGFWLRTGDQRSTSAGLDGNGPPISWRVRGDKLEILEYGEEGEHGDFLTFDAKITGDTLKITPAFHDRTEFRDMDSPTSKKTPVIFDVRDVDHKVLKFVVLNNSKVPIVITGHLGHLSAKTVEGNNLRHIIDDGFNAEVKPLTTADLITIDPGKSFLFERPVREMGAYLEPGMSVDCKVEPVTMSQIDAFYKPDASKLSKYFLSKPLTYKLVISTNR